MRSPGSVLSSSVILSAGTVFFALLALNLTNWRYYAADLPGIAYHIALPAGLGLLCLAALWLSTAWRAAIAVSFASVVPALYAAELFVTLDQDSRAAAATDQVDRRGKLEAILALRAAGVDAWPAMRGKALLETADTGGPLHSPIEADGRELLPLASVPGARIVACNEAGHWVTYDSDRHGFRNPDRVWDDQTPRVALIGDSFVQGDCVVDEATVAARLRPTLGPVVNLGVSGAGPLSKLAALVEYARPKAPRHVVWFFFEGNDLTKDLPTERRSPLLLGYLQDGFSQSLMGRPDALSASLRAFLEAHLQDAMAAVDHPQEALLDFLTLYRLRESFGLDPIGLGLVGDALEQQLTLFRRVMTTAKRRVEEWGGRLHVVYLPDSARYFASARNSRVRDWLRTEVLAIVRTTGIELIDVHEVFAGHPDPRALFRFAGSHYNETGYLVVSEAIGRALTNRTIGRLE